MLLAGFRDPFRRQILQWSIHWWIIHINYSAINVWDFANCSLLFPCTRSNLRLKIPTLHLKTSIIHIILINTWPYTVWLAQMSLPKPTKNQCILRVCRMKNNHRINDVNRLMKWCVKKKNRPEPSNFPLSVLHFNAMQTHVLPIYLPGT